LSIAVLSISDRPLALIFFLINMQNSDS